MDILQPPMLNDEDRRRVFFEAMPELFLSELLNELVHKRCFLYARLDALEEYDMLTKRGSFEFEREVYRDAYQDFKVSYETLMDFTEAQMLTDENAMTVKLTSNYTDSNHYIKLKSKLDSLCYEVADRYKRVVSVFSKESVTSEPISSIIKLNNTLWLGSKSYTARSKRAKGMLIALWDGRVKKKDVKKVHWISPENAALSMGLIRSSKDYSQNDWNLIDETRKSINRRIKANGIKAEILVNDSDELLFVLFE